MAGIGPTQLSAAIHRAVNHRGVFLAAGTLDQETVDARHHVVDSDLSFGGENERALKQRGQQCGAHAFARYIHDDARVHVGSDAAHVKIITTHLARGNARSNGAKPAFGGQLARQQTGLDGSSDIELFFHVLLGAFFFQQSRVLENRRGLERERLQNLAIAGRKVRRGPARIHIQHAHGIGHRTGDRFLERSGSHLNQRYADHAAQFQVRDRHFWPDAIGAQWIERHRKQIAPAAERSIDQRAGNAQV